MINKKAKDRKQSSNSDWTTQAQQIATEILEEMQFPSDHIRDAMGACGSNTQAHVDYIVSFGAGYKKPASRWQPSERV